MTPNNDKRKILENFAIQLHKISCNGLTKKTIDDIYDTTLAELEKLEPKVMSEEEIYQVVNEATNDECIDIGYIAKALSGRVPKVSREMLIGIIKSKHIYTDGVMDTDVFVTVPLNGLVDAILNTKGE